MDLAFTEDLIKRHEAIRYRVYLDSKGIPTAGVGLNLLSPGAPQLLSAVGADYGQVLHGNVELTTDQVERLFQHCLSRAITWAKDDVPNFDELPDKVQAVLTDMAFNMGERGLRGFTKAIARLQVKDYLGAAAEFKDSAWYIQVKSRGIEDVGIIREAGAVVNA